MPRFRSNLFAAASARNFSSRSRGTDVAADLYAGLAAGAAGWFGGHALLGTWLWHSGWPERQADRLANASLRMTKKARFALKDITVKGRKYTSKKEILDALGVSAGMTLGASTLTRRTPASRSS